MRGQVDDKEMHDSEDQQGRMNRHNATSGNEWM